MRKMITTAVLVFLVTATAFAHAGETHTLLGTVKKLHDNHLVITTTEGKEVTVLLAEGTRLWKGNVLAKREDLTLGARVSVLVAKDGKTATSVKIGSKKKGK